MKEKMRFFGVNILGIMLLSSLALTSCKDDNGDDPDNGRVDPGTIATANLVAYFPFNGNATEQIASLTPTMSPNVTYVDGRRGQAYQGADNAHLLYDLPANSPMRNLTSFTVATWFRSPLVTGDPEQLFFQIGKSDDLFWGNLSLGLLRLDSTADSLKFKIFFYKDGVAWSGQHLDFSSSMFPTNTWMHLVYTYDGASSKFMIYKDGAKVTTNEGIEDRWAAGDDVSPRPPLGPLSFTNADVINIGAWRPKTEGNAEDAWMGWFRGNLDELRVYNKALTAAEVSSLYQAEVSQLD
jgi:hypothetical protein